MLFGASSQTYSAIIAYAWFPVDRNGIVKSSEPSKFQLIARKFARNYNKNLLGCKSELISDGFLFSDVMNRSTINQNLPESHDFTI